jgi:hypothetical protein
MNVPLRTDFLPDVGSFAVDPQLYPELLFYPLAVAALGGVVMAVRGDRGLRVVHAAALGYVVGAVLLLGVLPDLPPPEIFGAPRYPVELRPLRMLIPPPSTGAGWSTMVKQYGGNIAYFVPFGVVVAARPGTVPRLWVLTLAAGGLSVLVELMQLILGTYRVVSVDDVLCNTLGGLLGAVVIIGLRRLVRGRTAGAGEHPFPPS